MVVCMTRCFSINWNFSQCILLMRLFPLKWYRCNSFLRKFLIVKWSYQHRILPSNQKYFQIYCFEKSEKKKNERHIMAWTRMFSFESGRFLNSINKFSKLVIVKFSLRFWSDNRHLSEEFSSCSFCTSVHYCSVLLYKNSSLKVGRASTYK